MFCIAGIHYNTTRSTFWWKINLATCLMHEHAMYLGLIGILSKEKNVKTGINFVYLLATLFVILVIDLRLGLVRLLFVFLLFLLGRSLLSCSALNKQHMVQ